jgi:hypothetical protein
MHCDLLQVIRISSTHLMVRNSIIILYFNGVHITRLYTKSWFIEVLYFSVRSCNIFCFSMLMTVYIFRLKLLNHLHSPVMTT